MRLLFCLAAGICLTGCDAISRALNDHLLPSEFVKVAVNTYESPFDVWQDKQRGVTCFVSETKDISCVVADLKYEKRILEVVPILPSEEHATK
jgi:hypothetical protein